MYRKILVATDLTEASGPAIRAALALAKEGGGEVTVLHVTEPAYPAHHWYVPYIGDDAQVLRDIVARELDAARKALETQVELAGGGGRPVVRVGRPATVIVDTARELDADLVVVGTHGRTGLEHVLLGSVAEHVVRTASSPVLTVRSATEGSSS